MSEKNESVADPDAMAAATDARKKATALYKGRWVWVTAGALVVLVFVFVMIRRLSNEPRHQTNAAPPPAQEAQVQAEQAAPSPAQNAPAQQVQDVPVVNGFRDFRLTLSETEWSEPVNVLHTECIEWGRTNPDMPGVSVEARGVTGPWMGWDEYQHRRNSGEHGDPAWFRFKAESPNQGVWYKVGVRDTCS